MSRRTVRVEIPVGKPDDFIKLLGRTLQKDNEMGNESPLKNFNKVDMDKYKVHLESAETNRLESEKLREQSEAKMQQARIELGTDKGQSINTPDTLYYLIALIRDYLLVVYAGNEEVLSEWGFKVVVGEAKSPGSTNDDDEIEPGGLKLG